MGLFKSPYKREPQRLYFPFPYKIQQENGQVGSEPDVDSHQHKAYQFLDLGLPTLPNCEKQICVIYKTSSLWYFIIATKTKILSCRTNYV